MAKVKTPRWAWALMEPEHFFQECLRMLGKLDDVALFVSKASSEVVRMYRQEFKLPPAARLFRDTTTRAKGVMGISDTLVTNVFAQAGRCRLPAIIFPCDTAPELETEAPKGVVKVYPREIDLKNTGRLKSFESTVVVESLEDLRTALGRPRPELHG